MVNFGDFGPLSRFGPHWAISGHFRGLGYFWPFGPIWAVLGHFTEGDTSSHFGPLSPFWLLGPLSAILGHFWGLAHFGPFWATFGVPILGFRFGYDQVDCVAPVFKKRLT